LRTALTWNVTLFLGLTRYRKVVNAFVDSLDALATAGQPIERVASVASFFASRIDSLVDARLDALGTPQAKALRGCAAIATAQLAYEIYKE